jgi:hypothetical protein
MESATTKAWARYTMSDQCKKTIHKTLWIFDVSTLRYRQHSFVLRTQDSESREILKFYLGKVEEGLILHRIAARFDDELHQFSSVQFLSRKPEILLTVLPIPNLSNQ